jgi:hypothetical protein
VLCDIYDRGCPQEDIPFLVTRSLEIGGDPDTICSLAMSLYGLRWPAESEKFLTQICLSDS